MARGRARKTKGSGADSRIPPNVRRAASRVKKGEADSADQKLLASWRDREKRRAELKRPQTTDEARTTAESRVKELGIESAVAVKSGPPRDVAERKLLAKAEARGEAAVVFTGRPAVEEGRTPDGGLRLSLRDQDGPAVTISAAKDPELGWVVREQHHRRGGDDRVVEEHPSRARAEREARSLAEYESSPEGGWGWQNAVIVKRLDRGRGATELEDFTGFDRWARPKWLGPDGAPHTTGEIYLIQGGQG